MPTYIITILFIHLIILLIHAYASFPHHFIIVCYAGMGGYINEWVGGWACPCVPVCAEGGRPGKGISEKNGNETKKQQVFKKKKRTGRRGFGTS